MDFRAAQLKLRPWSPPHAWQGSWGSSALRCGASERAFETCQALAERRRHGATALTHIDLYHMIILNYIQKIYLMLIIILYNIIYYIYNTLINLTNRDVMNLR